MKSFKLGDKVKTKDNHDYLNISKRMIGTVTNIFNKGTSTEAMFNKHKIIFVTQELKKVTKKNAKKKQK